MRLKTLLQTGLAFASLALVAPQLSVSGYLVSPAAAAVEVEIGTDQFYDDLAPFGDWVWYRGGYVFVPGDVDDRWRPYAVGRWVYTDDYGWLWVSDEPFGWATYHYGRWGYGDDLGWYWVPGRVWAPAWVSWRRGPDYVVWAPLPPTFGDDYYDDENDGDYEVADDDIPDNYWNAVPAVSFLAANLAAFIYADDDEDYGYHHRRYIDETEALGPVRYRNNRVFNNGLDAGFIEKETNEKVHRYKIRETDDYRRAGKHDGDEIEVFDRKVRARPDAKPRTVKNVSEVEQKHGKRWKGANSNEQEMNSKKKAGSNQPEFGGGQEQPGNVKKQRSQQSNGEIDNSNRKKNADQTDEQSNTGQKLTKKQKRQAEQQKKKQRNQQLSNENEQGSAQGQGKKKKRNQNTSNQDQLGVMDSQGNQGKKKKKRNQDASSETYQNSDGVSNQQGKKKKRNQDASSQNSENSDGLSSQQEKKKKRNQTSDFGNDSQSQSGNNKKRKKSDCDPNSGECQ